MNMRLLTAVILGNLPIMAFADTATLEGIAGQMENQGYFSVALIALTLAVLIVLIIVLGKSKKLSDKLTDVEELAELTAKNVKSMRPETSSGQAGSGKTNRPWPSKTESASSGEAIREMRSELSQLKEQLDKMRKEFKSTLEESLTGASPGTDASPKESKKKATSEDAETAYWPQAFEKGQKLAPYRKQLLKALKNPSTEAVGQRLLLELLRFDLLSKESSSPRLNEVADVTYSLSERLYEYLAITTSPEEDNYIEMVTRWHAEYKKQAQQLAPGLEIKAFFPSSRIDTDTMEKIDQGSRLTVSQAYSWMVADAGTENKQIIYRARVATG